MNVESNSMTSTLGGTGGKEGVSVGARRTTSSDGGGGGSGAVLKKHKLIHKTPVDLVGDDDDIDSFFSSSASVSSASSFFAAQPGVAQGSEGKTRVGRSVSRPHTPTQTPLTLSPLNESTDDPVSVSRDTGDAARPASTSSAGVDAKLTPTPTPTPTPPTTTPTPGGIKKYRGREIDWKITILTPQTFKTFLVIICRVLTHCPFQLFKSDTFTGLRVDSMDSSMVCMIKASYECEIESNVSLTGENFSVVTATFSTLLKDVQTGHILTLTRFADSSDLTVNSYSRDNENNRSTSTLNIIDEECNAENLRMPDITYQYMVEMDLPRFKSYCKMAHDIDSSHMEFQIDEPIAPEGAGDGLRDLFFSIGAASDVATFQKVHFSTARTQSGTANVQFYIKSVSEDLCEEENELPLEQKYSEIFSTAYLNSVLKSMDRQTVQLYMSKSLPLVIRYSLGNDQSHIQVILAPRLRDGDTE